MEQKRTQKGAEIIRLNHSIPVTPLTVFCAAVLLYFIIQIIILCVRSPLETYSVGAAVSDNVSGEYRGIVIRDEFVVQAEEKGYVTFFAVANEYRKGNSVLATIDPYGEIVSKLYETVNGNMNLLSNASLLTIRKAIREGSGGMDLISFSGAYSLKTSVQSTILECLINENNAEIQKALAEIYFSEVRSSSTGYFENWQDGFEGLTEAEVTSEILLTGKDNKVFRNSGDAVETGDFLFKVFPGNSFKLCFLLEESEAERLKDRTKLTIEAENGITCTGSFSISTTADGKPMGILSFRSYGGNFNCRFLSFKLLDQKTTGFKIPESALISKEFYVVEKRFITSGGSSNTKGVLVEKDGLAVFIPCTVYEYGSGDNFVIGEDSAYLFSSEISAGMTIIAPTAAEGEENLSKTMVIGPVTTVEGVYQINKGYCVFKPIVRLKNSLESSYVMISANVRSGLQAYDRIVLNAEGVKENELIFE